MTTKYFVPATQFRHGKLEIIGTPTPIEFHSSGRYNVTLPDGTQIRYKQELYDSVEAATAAAQATCDKYNGRSRKQRKFICPVCGHVVENHQGFEDVQGWYRHDWC